MEETIGFAIAQLCRAHRNAVDVALSAHGLYVGQEMILRQLWQGDGLAQAQLGERLCVEPPTVSKMLQRMERAGLVARRPDPADARVTRVYLTDQGRDLRPAVEAAWMAVEERAAAGLSASERAELRRLLARARANLVGDLGRAP